MNSIGSFSPRAFLQGELTSQISSGQIKASDKAALTSALDDIDSALKTAGAGSSGPADMASKIDDLISEQEKTGKLTSEQASELRDFFSDVFAKGPQQAGQGSGTSASDQNDIIDQFLKVLQEASQYGYTSVGGSAVSTNSLLLDVTA